MSAGIVLKVTPTELNRKATSLEKILDKIEAQIHLLNSAIEYTNRYWEGDAHNMHKTQYEEFKDELQEIIERLQNYPDKIRRMAGVYSISENKAEELAARLKTNIIS